MTMMTIHLSLPDEYKAAPSAVIKLHLKLIVIIGIIMILIGFKSIMLNRQKDHLKKIYDSNAAHYALALCF